MALTEITSKGIKDADIATADIADDAITQAKIADESVDEARIQISNAGTNGQYLQKQSGNTGGLTWADVPAGVGGATGVDFNDTIKARFGTGNDLEIYHDATDSLVKNATGDLILQSTGDDVFIKAEDDVFIKVKGGAETAIECHSDGQVELYYDHVKKLETDSAGVNIAGQLDMTSNISILDTKKITFGNSDDLEIYHNGTNSYIDNHTGLLVIRNAGAGNIYIQPVDGEYSINAIPNGAVELYYDNVKSLVTNSTGIEVLGAEGASGVIGLSADEADDNADIWRMRGNTDGTFDLQNYASGSYETAIKATGNGAVELYYDNVKTFETNDEGVKVSNGTSAAVLSVVGGEGTDSTIYQAADDGDDSADKWKMVASASGSNWTLYNAASGSWENSIKAIGDGAVELYHNNSQKLTTATGGVIVTGDLVADNLYLGDNEKLYVGAGDDLQIYHTSNESWIKNNTGTLNILNDGTVQIKNNADNETIAQFTEGGACKFWYNTSLKLETTSSGIKVDDSTILLDNSDGATYLKMVSSNGHSNVLEFGDEDDDDVGELWYDHYNKTFNHRMNESGKFNFYAKQSTQTTEVFHIHKADAASNVQSHMIVFDVGGSGRGGIHAASSGSANPGFMTYSDRRLKTNFRPYTGGYDKIKAIPVKLYDEVSNDETKSIIGENPAKDVVGWIADEFQTVFPEAVSGTKDAVDSNNKPIYQNLSQGTIFPDVVQALQAAIAKIETLETKVAALEAA